MPKQKPIFGLWEDVNDGDLVNLLLEGRASMPVHIVEAGSDHTAIRYESFNNPSQDLKIALIGTSGKIHVCHTSAHIKAYNTQIGVKGYEVLKRAKKK